MKAPVTRVLLADDHALVRAGLRKILEARSDFAVVGEAADGRAALAALAQHPVDVVVLDLSMPGADGFEVLRRAKSIRAGLKVLVLTMHASGEHVARAVREGADGYLLKDSAVQDLVAAIHSVMAGREYYSPSVQRELTDLVRGETGRRRSEPITGREREVLKLVAQGLSTKEIAGRLEISSRTVESHRANLMRKLGVHSVAMLTQYAIREGLIDPP